VGADSAGASMNAPSPELQQLAVNFLATFFSRRPPRVRVRVRVSLHLVSCLTVHIHQRIRILSLPIRLFQGPLYTVIGPFYPCAPPGRGIRGGLRRLWVQMQPQGGSETCLGVIYRGKL